MTIIKHEIIFNDNGKEHVSCLNSVWDGLICKQSWFSGLPASLQSLEELVAYSVLEGNINHGTIYMTKYGPQWADVFEGEDTEIKKTVEIIVKRKS